MKSLRLFFVLSVTCTLSSAYVPRKEIIDVLLPEQRQELSVYANSKALIEDLIRGLRKSAKDASDTIKTFASGVQDEVKAVRVNIATDIQKLRDQISEAVENVTNRLIDSGVSVTECIVTYREDANAVFNETLVKTTSCVEDRVSEVNDQINRFVDLVNNATAYSNTAINNMKSCTDSGNILLTGSCLGTIALQTDMKAVAFTGQVGLMLARMEMLMATLPASLQVCAATRLVEASVHSAKVIMDIGTCSASSVYAIMTGNEQAK